MLDHMEECGDKSIVSWQPHGRAFTVHKSKEFVALIMPQFFNQTKYASFQRQLNLYGFSRLTHGPDKGAYYHSCFIRGERNLCRRMIRQKIKGTMVRKTLAPEEEPNFYKMTGKLPMIPSQDSIAASTTGLTLQVEAPPVEVTPIVTKPIMNKRQMAATSSSTTTSSIQPSIVSPRETETMMPTVSNMMRTVSPHLSSSTLYDPKYASSASQQEDAKGGDLLFFEGRPFRYLEHIEVLPPLPQSMSSNSNRPRLMINTQYTNPSATSLHDMITAIVDLEPPQKKREYQSTQWISSV
jgi:hypothetical protein